MTSSKATALRAEAAELRAKSERLRQRAIKVELQGREDYAYALRDESDALDRQAIAIDTRANVVERGLAPDVEDESNGEDPSMQSPDAVVKGPWGGYGSGEVRLKLTPSRSHLRLGLRLETPAGVTTRSFPLDKKAVNELFRHLSRLRNEMGMRTFMPAPCPVCGEMVFDNYMLREKVWKQAVRPGERTMHFRCVEQRLGRRLSLDDFDPAKPRANSEVTFGYAMALNEVAEGYARVYKRELEVGQTWASNDEEVPARIVMIDPVAVVFESDRGERAALTHDQFRAVYPLRVRADENENENGVE